MRWQGKGLGKAPPTMDMCKCGKSKNVDDKKCIKCMRHFAKEKWSKYPDKIDKKQYPNRDE